MRFLPITPTAVSALLAGMATQASALSPEFEETQLYFSYSQIDGSFGDTSTTSIGASTKIAFSPRFGVQLGFSGTRFDDDFLDSEDIHTASVIGTYSATPDWTFGVSYSHYWLEDGDFEDDSATYGLHALYRTQPLRFEAAILIPDEEDTGFFGAADIRYDINPKVEINGFLARYFDNDDDDFDEGATFISAGAAYNFTQRFAITGTFGTVIEDEDDEDNYFHDLGVRYDATPEVRLWALASRYTYDEEEDTGFSLGLTYTFGGTTDNPQSFVIGSVQDYFRF